MTTKTYARRDSATTVLRKLGVNPRDYNIFITKLPGDNWQVDTAAATAHVTGVELQTAGAENSSKPSAETAGTQHFARTAPFTEDETKAADEAMTAKVAKSKLPRALSADATKITAAPKKPAKAKKQPKKDPTKRTVTEAIKSMLLEGLTNLSIWEVVKEEFNLDDSKRHYPAWYRSSMKRNGQLPKK